TRVDLDQFHGMISISGLADRAISPVLLRLLLEDPCAAAGREWPAQLPASIPARRPSGADSPAPGAAAGIAEAAVEAASAAR
ncbi:hypothetical protein ABTO00_19685, partial [Acinetobacter baumannii]